jgi:hypothetical protein
VCVCVCVCLCVSVCVCTLDKQFVIRLLASITEQSKAGVDKRKNANFFGFFPQHFLSDDEVNSLKKVLFFRPQLRYR